MSVLIVSRRSSKEIHLQQQLLDGVLEKKKAEASPQGPPSSVPSFNANKLIHKGKCEEDGWLVGEPVHNRHLVFYHHILFCHYGMKEK